jgi:hypothetical protein
VRSFDVRAEVFPVTMVDRQGALLPELRYYVFHNLEGVREAMDEGQSEWIGDHDVGFPRLVLKDAGFEHRPLFKCNHIYVSLMRDDLKQEIRRQGMTGFAFLAPERYRSGQYGVALAFED